MWEQKIKKSLDKTPNSIPVFNAPRVAAALLLIKPMKEETGFEVLLTKRTLNVHHHKGQISLPGGFPEPSDTDWQGTALRETEEEIGVRKDQIDLLGVLKCVETKGGVKIVVCVGVLREAFKLKINPAEVDKVFFLPSSVLLEKGLNRVLAQDSGMAISSIGLEWQGELVWGATARILEIVYQILKEPS